MNVETLQTFLAIGGSLGFLLLWVIRGVIAPVQTTLKQLNESIEKLEKTIREERQHREGIELKLQSIVVREEGIIRRIDKLEERENACLNG